MKIQAVTIGVSDLDRSRRFYEDLLGFGPDMYYEETKWQSYRCAETAFFAIAEIDALDRAGAPDIINFEIDDVNALWARIKDRVAVESSPAPTPWGSFKMVVLDPDGYRLGFVEGDGEE